MNKPLTVLILAAGYGRRMGPFSRMVNKSLIPYDNKPLISHIIDKFEPGTRYVIACGHNGQQVRDYVGIVHSDKYVVFVDIPDFSEGNTGPATTIRHCAKHIRGGFMWLACDTLFDFNYLDKLDHNWIGVHPVNSDISRDYCWITRDGERIASIKNKVTSRNAVDAFIGLMYCKDDAYLDNLITTDAREPYQGFLENLDLKAHTVCNWLDFGTYEKWQELNAELPEVSFPKPNEIFYSDNGKIVKFALDPALTERKLQRAQLNPDCMPANVRAAGQFLAYDYVPGQLVYETASPSTVTNLLNWCEQSLWQRKWFPDTEPLCREFYQRKTQDRLTQFRTKYHDWSEPCMINDVAVQTIDQYLEQIDWDYLCTTADWRFVHGDCQWENIIHDPDTGKFTVIDWRTDFAGNMYGDVYYDLAKMLGGMFLNYQSIKRDEFGYDESNDVVWMSVPSVTDYDIYHDQLRSWVIDRGMDWHKVLMLVPIIYLNMSPLHDAPFDKFLFALAQYKFQEYIDEVNRRN